jgi:hypothetical protein
VAHQRNALHELSRRSLDLHLLFDMEGKICYASSESACVHLLGRVSKSLFDEPLSKILAPEAQSAFELYINHVIEAQSVRELLPEERRVRTVFVDAQGRQRHVEGHGQAWQRGVHIELVYSFREISVPHMAPASSIMAPAPGWFAMEASRTAGAMGSPMMSSFASKPAMMYAPPYPPTGPRDLSLSSAVVMPPPSASASSSSGMQ